MTAKNETKSKIVELLRRRTTSLTAIAKELQCSPTTIHRHLKELMEAQIIECIIFSGGGSKYYKAVQ